MKPARFARLLVIALPLILGCACSSLGYYSQLARGQWALLQSRQPVDDVLLSPAASPGTKRKLTLALKARAFASEKLGLPDNGSYRLFVKLDRPYVVWNLFATEEFSVEPITHCFPIAGCVAYQGFYQQTDAQQAADKLASQGKDTFIGGVNAYSTLGWFNDPLLSTMLNWPDDRLAALIFHELAHQKYYLKGDTAFNESYASFVEREGLGQWQLAQGRSPQADNQAAIRDAITKLVLNTREKLNALYAKQLPPQQMRAGKAKLFAQLRLDYQRWKAQHNIAQIGYESWFGSKLNNASLLPFGLYDGWVKAFAQLFENNHRQWPAFYKAVGKLGSLDDKARNQALRQLMQQAQSQRPHQGERGD